MKTVEEAQLHNARKMTVRQLNDQIRLVASYPEQPPVRQRWLIVLHEELGRRENPEADK